MSLGSAMNTAVAALNAQSKQLSLISGNLANSSTVGYKTTNAQFSTLLTESSSGSYSSTSVRTYAKQNVSSQGEIQSSSTSTNVAIDGYGMFPVTYDADSTQLYFTRNGEFSPDNEGYLCNGSYYLMGWPTDSEGNIQSSDVSSVNGLETINVNRFSTTAEASTEAALEANLPADADVDFTTTTSISIYDSLGTAQSVPMDWTKTAENTWTVTLGNPTNPTSGDETGTISGTTSYQITFDSDGKLESISSDTDGDGTFETTDLTELTITASFNDGASDSTVSLGVGTIGSTDGLSQYAQGSTTPSIEIQSSTSDGYEYGSLTGVSIGTDGSVVASYDNGQSLTIYKVPVATFSNYDGLDQRSDGVYMMTGASGAYTLHEAGTGGSGKIDGGSLESSTTDTSGQLSLMILAQQAYSAASQVISTSNQMYNDLIQAFS